MISTSHLMKLDLTHSRVFFLHNVWWQGYSYFLIFMCKLPFRIKRPKMEKTGSTEEPHGSTSKGSLEEVLAKLYDLVISHLFVACT